MRRSGAAVLCLVAALGTAARADEPTIGDTYVRGVRTARSAMRYPPLLDYDVAVTTVIGTARRTDTYSGQVQPSTGDFRVRAFSDYEEAHPHVPRGIDVVVTFGVSVGSGSAPVAAAPKAPVSVGIPLTHVPAVEPFAVPELQPLYSFGILACAARRVPAIEPIAGPPVIGSVTTVSRRYRIDVVGNDNVDGVDAVHLAFTPLLDPDRDRLRDLWVATATNHALQARISGNFTDEPDSHVPWLIRFAELDGATYITTEASEAPLMRGTTRIDRVEIAFKHVRRGQMRSLAFALPFDTSNLNTVEEPLEPGASCAGNLAR